jgi:hypothetical protein
MSEAQQATGTFEIDSWNDEIYDKGDGASLGRTRLTKVFSGDLVGRSAVDLLAVSVPVAGSEEQQGAAYVAVERFTGSVRGRSGGFVLTHVASRAQGMSVSVVDGSADGELAGLTGTLHISRHEDGSHTYTFDYQLG